MHLEGMGWLGAATAFRLDRDGIPFTWHDTDSRITAWKASTGLVFPAGDDQSQQGMKGWQRWHADRLFPDGTVRLAAYVYAHRNPPHEGSYHHTLVGKHLRVAHAPCYAVDAPAIVAAARRQFADRRRDQAPGGATVLRCHGYGERRRSYLWGWSAPVALTLPDELIRAVGNRPPALYGRAHRFQMVYAYPIPTRPGWWWAGSSLVNQRTPGNGDASAAFARWKAALPAVYGGEVRLADAEPPVLGWRPRAAPDEPYEIREDSDGAYSYPSLWHSGIRWCPPLVEQMITKAVQ